MYKKILFSILLINSVVAFSQNEVEEPKHIEDVEIEVTDKWLEKINWVDFETAISMRDESPKKIFMFVYTPWCNFCNLTKETLLIDDQFAQTINDEYIPVKFDAESMDTIHFLDLDFVFQEESGYHELPIVFSQGELAFPTMFFFNEDLKLVSTVKGFQENIIEFTDYVDYIGNDSYLTIPWIDYEKEEQNKSN